MVSLIINKERGRFKTNNRFINWSETLTPAQLAWTLVRIIIRG